MILIQQISCEANKQQAMMSQKQHQWTDDRVHPCCGLLQIIAWGVKHCGCTNTTHPFHEQLILAETAFCGICHKNCPSVADFVLHHECTHLCIPLFVCTVCHYPYITRSALQMHITGVHKREVSVQQTMSFNYNF